MADKLYIVNAALGHLGEPSAPNLDEATLREATRKVLMHIEHSRDAVLARADWLCAMAYETITVSALPGDWRYSYVYDLPADALRVTMVDGTFAWEAGSRTDDNGATRRVVRAASAGPINAAFVRRAPWEGLTAGVADAIGLDCASRACHPINGNLERARELRRLADAAIELAASADGAQSGGLDGWITDELYALRQSSA